MDKLSIARSAYENEADAAKKETAKTAYVAELNTAISAAGTAGDADKKKKLEEELAKVRGPAGTSADVQNAGRRRRRRGGKHTKRHKKGGKSKRARTGRKSTRL